MRVEAEARVETREEEALEGHFETLERQREASRFGMWVFLASEVLLFSGFFALYATLRSQHPAGFVEGAKHAEVIIGSVNTIVLLVSSYLAARAVHALRKDETSLAALLTLGTVALGVTFLFLKGWEYWKHVAEGAIPGGGTEFFVHHATPGVISYFNLYWLATFLHAIHVLVGTSAIGVCSIALFRKRLRAVQSQRLEITALYWHLVDAIWIVLWPLFYLMR